MRRDTKNKVWKMHFIECACQIDWQNKYPPPPAPLSLSRPISTFFSFLAYSQWAIRFRRTLHLRSHRYIEFRFLCSTCLFHTLLSACNAAQLPMNDFNICALRLTLNCCRCRVCNCSFVYSQSIFGV